MDSFLYETILDNMVFSYSNLSSFCTCPEMWYLTYIEPIDKSKKIDNFFSQYGSLLHHILDKYEKQELELSELFVYFENNYDAWITEPAPFEKMGKKYYDDAYKYLTTFEGFPGDTIASEKKIDYGFYINREHRFTGIIDRICKIDNKLVIVDHKSKARFKSKQEEREYARQLYLYSIAVHNDYGVWPSELWFNHFRSLEYTKIKFSMDELNETFLWVRDTLNNMYSKRIFYKNTNDFFCSQLCSVEPSCSLIEKNIFLKEEK